jgi:HEPN domain-containing protein
MQLDLQKVSETREWLQHARADLDSAAVLIGAVPSHPDTGLFHCQQAVEKAWKALLVWHSVPFRRTHDLRELGGDCAQLDGSLSGLAVRAEDLTPFAWDFRYPGAPALPTRPEVEALLALAHDVYAAVIARLPPEVRP